MSRADRDSQPEDDSGLELDWGSRAPRPGGEAGQAAPPKEAPPTGRPGVGPPGDPECMSIELRFALEPLFEAQGLQANQVTQWTEALLSWEQGNKYVVQALDGRALYFVGEEGGGFLASLARNFWAFRTLSLEFMTQNGTRAMRLERPWRPFFSRANVQAWDGRTMGVIQQRFSLIRRKLEVLSPAGNPWATIVGPVFKPWTFEVHQKGAHVATIRKQWSGLGTELYTDSDNFGIEFRAPLDGRLRQLLVAATLMIDLLWFEAPGGGKGQGGGIVGLLDG